MNDVIDINALLGIDSFGRSPGGVDQLELGTMLDETFDISEIPVGSRVVRYLRVSDPSQVKTDYDPLGQSIPSQRVACQQREDDMALICVGEYVEPGRSATEITKRIAFRQMIARIRQMRDVDYVIVYKFSRAARNQWEDAILGVLLMKMGVKLISATEPIDDSAAGKAMRGMISVFNEYQSNASGEDIKFKMQQKAMRGGSLGRAKLGYKNIRDNFEGREVRTIAIDEERAPYVKQAFELYATGEYTLNDIVDELTDRGLIMKAFGKRPAGPISVNKVHQMLQDPYYTGVVVYKGEQYEGRHEPLIDKDLFDKVQKIIRSRGRAGERRREHHHYLKGTVFCGICKSERGIDRRLLVQRSVGKTGNEYFYYFCPGTKDGTCTSPHHNLFRVEDAVERHYKTKRLSSEFLTAVRALMADTLSDQDEAQRLLKKQLDAQLQTLETQEENLLDLAADGTVSSGKIKMRLRKIDDERKRLTAQRDDVALDLTAGARYLDAQLKLLENPYDLYVDTTDEIRRRLNQALFGAIYIIDDDVAGSSLTPPNDELLAAEAAFQSALINLDQEAIRRHYLRAFAIGHGAFPAKHKETARESGLFADNSTVATTAWASLFHGSALDAVSSKPLMVEPRGIEPLTSCLQSRRSTN